MKRRRLLLLLGGMAFYGAALAGASQAAQPERFKLELVRLEPVASDAGMTAAQWRYRNVSPQHFFWPLGKTMGYELPFEREFKTAVKKDREKYLSKQPLRGVATLGSQKFGFVLDQKDEKSKGYDRLYFDLNGNGDLTDDRPIDAASTRQLPILVASYTQSHFPRVDLSIDVDGKKLDYSFFLELLTYGSGDVRYVSASLTAAVYRRGEITLDGKKWTVTLLDHNSNGRFDDLTSLHENIRGGEGQLYPNYGDVLLLEGERLTPPRPRAPAAAGESQQYLGKINSLGGKLYELKVTPRGDELTVTPSTVPLGKVASPHAPCSLELIGPQGYLSLNLEKDGAAKVPAGQWRLLSYTLTVENWQPPAAREENKKTDEAKKKGGGKAAASAKPSLWKALQKAFLGPIADVIEPLYGPAATSQLSASGTVVGRPITVEAGKTATLRFGPPYQAAAKLVYVHEGKAKISLAITGADGEVVSNLFVNGRRPPKPKIKITGPDGKTVAEGDFEYG